MENPWESASWATADGFSVRPEYYALKHYSKHVSTGDTRRRRGFQR